MVGVVVKPWQHVSLYANYIEGLSKGDIAPANASNPGQVLAPYKSKQYEAGVKVDALGTISTLSVFQITKPSGALVHGRGVSSLPLTNSAIGVSSWMWSVHRWKTCV
nr:TonB-dependent receptor [Pectobacterium sp. PL152]